MATDGCDHARYVLNAFAKLHGGIVYEQYTGRFKRQCWLEDESNAGGSRALANTTCI